MRRLTNKLSTLSQHMDIGEVVKGRTFVHLKCASLTTEATGEEGKYADLQLARTKNF